MGIYVATGLSDTIKLLTECANAVPLTARKIGTLLLTKKQSPRERCFYLESTFFRQNDLTAYQSIPNTSAQPQVVCVLPQPLLHLPQLLCLSPIHPVVVDDEAPHGGTLLLHPG